MVHGMERLKRMKICIVGLGYVGLPLAVAFSKHFNVIGFDISGKRINELKQGIDFTLEVEKEKLLSSGIQFTSEPSDIKKADFIIVAVPTPLKENKEPDLSFLENASKIVGRNMKRGMIVVYESTVYPGVTEEFCLPILEKESGMAAGQDFKIGYSPERINPGDKKHRVENIVKVVSGMDKESLEIIAEVYGRVVKAGIHKAPTIRTAEAAKVIENIQRDLNIALMNELSLLFEKMGIDTHDVIEAAATKWNFHRYTPGLVGGHCIGIDPYYLTYRAKQLGYNPKVILAGREINDAMPKHVAALTERLLERAGKKLKQSKILIMGLTFKENVSDTRNSKAKELIKHFTASGAEVVGYDPLLSKKRVRAVFGVENVDFKKLRNIDAVIVFSPHQQFKTIKLDSVKQITSKNPVLVDIKAFYDKEKALGKGFIYKRL